MKHCQAIDLLVVEGAYHGNTGTLIKISPYKFMGKGGTGSPEPWVHVVPLPDGYRGMYKGSDKSVGTAYGNEVERIIAEAEAPIAGIILEPLFSCAGQIIPPNGYLETVFQHVRNVGGLCIVDEVQVGFGRVGSHFWGFQLQDVIPDIVVMGKPMGNGHPMGAVVTTQEIAESFANGMEFFSTFGGNPVSCKIGIAVLNVLEEEKLQDNARILGNYFLEELRGLKQEFELIGDVRGAGLFLGIELVRDRISLEPATKEAGILVNRLKGRGMLLSTDGPFSNIIKIKPPMVINSDDVDMVVRSMRDEFSNMTSE
jgi:4-aminobutyrate aminotransferase-like enzyme